MSNLTALSLSTLGLLYNESLFGCIMKLSSRNLPMVTTFFFLSRFILHIPHIGPHCIYFILVYEFLFALVFELL